MQKYCFTLDLVDDPQLIEEYKADHQNVWPEIKQSITDAGIIHMEIYLLGNRLFMLMETDASFSFEKKAEMDAVNPKVQEWEALMWKYQQALPQAKPGEKWLLMNQIFHL
ncbi:MAG: L-rhamnose mutarotase [Sphingobacteriaceae bacterium]|nr:MAG: L-rhamnose mutarotase [Sphingobacteriaceae bacterium]